ncbi:MAG: hypothetical protein MJA27_33140, partial [Pseudanabaenales cyanobacterium]|nr:hypothetical protein [Pseudanabaenales cyanobacterium]
IRKLGDQAKTQLQLQLLQAASQNSEATDTKTRIQILLSRRVDRESNSAPPEETDSDQPTDILTETSKRPQASEADLESAPWISPEAPSSEHLSPDMSPQEDDEKTQDIPREPLTPSLVARQHLILEQRIREVLQTLSKTANYFLQQADILPALPESLLAAASESEAIAEVPAGPPNLLNLFVEIGGESNSEDNESEDSGAAEPPSMTHLIAINLRLSEIEFADSTVSAWRNKIRSLLGNLKKLTQTYKKKQRERASAEAEAAWRASWYEE